MDQVAIEHQFFELTVHLDTDQRLRLLEEFLMPHMKSDESAGFNKVLQAELKSQGYSNGEIKQMMEHSTEPDASLIIAMLSYAASLGLVDSFLKKIRN